MASYNNHNSNNYNFHPEMKIHSNDLPSNFHAPSKMVAIDTEATGLNHSRDRLCLVQMCFGDGVVHLVQISPNHTGSPNLCKILNDPEIKKIFHFGRFDIAILYRSLGALCNNIYCTKIASYFAMTYTNRHGIKELCRQLLKVEISKNEGASYWGAHELSPEQKRYAANDVIYLHDLKKELDKILTRENRIELVDKCFEFLPHRALLDCVGWDRVDIFSHSMDEK